MVCPAVRRRSRHRPTITRRMSAISPLAAASHRFLRLCRRRIVTRDALRHHRPLSANAIARRWFRSGRCSGIDGPAPLVQSFGEIPAVLTAIEVDVPIWPVECVIKAGPTPVARQQCDVSEVDHAVAGQVGRRQAHERFDREAAVHGGRVELIARDVDPDEARARSAVGVIGRVVHAGDAAIARARTLAADAD